MRSKDTNLSARKRDGNPNNSFWRGVAFLACAASFAFVAASDSRTAKTEENSNGTVTECHEASRGGHYCKYIFAVQHVQYLGDSSADSGTEYGMTATVYYDPANPATNSLIDFSEKSRKNRQFAYFIFPVGAGFLLYGISIARDKNKQSLF